VDETALATPFKRDDAVKPEILDQFSSRVAPEIKAPFDEGIAFLARGDYLKAEASVKKRIKPAGHSPPAPRPPRPTSGPAPGWCASATSVPRERFSKRRSANGRPTRASPSRSPSS